MTDAPTRIESALTALKDVVLDACSCRNVERRGCKGGECDCNKHAFPRGGILLPVPCERPLHKTMWALYVDVQKERV